MITIYLGNDKAVLEARARAYLFENEEDHEYTRIDSVGYVPGVIGDAINSTSLFGQASRYLLDTPKEDDAFLNECTTLFENIVYSQNSFVLIDSALSPELQKLCKAHSVVVEKLASKTEKEAFNPFTLSDALCARDRKTLWIRLMESRRQGIPTEEIVGILLWQLKVLRLAYIGKNAEEVDVKPFVYTKAKRAHARFKEDELQTLSADLIHRYHEGHLGIVPIDRGIEDWVLKL